MLVGRAAGGKSVTAVEEQNESACLTQLVHHEFISLLQSGDSLLAESLSQEIQPLGSSGVTGFTLLKTGLRLHCLTLGLPAVFTHFAHK